MAINRPVSQHLDKERIEYLYNIRCYGVPTIAKECGCNQNTIYRFMKQYGIKIRKQVDAARLSHSTPEVAVRMGQHKTFFDDETEKLICKEYMEYGVSAPILAKRHGCTNAIIRGVLRRRNTPKKSRKEILGDQFKGENNPNFGNGGKIAKENNVRWIHDRTKLKRCLREALRESLEYTNWRKAVFARDEYKCVVCQGQGYLEAHHIIKLSVLLRDNGITDYDEAIACQPLWEVGNGVTLCRSCHDKTKHKESEYVEIFKEVINQ